MAGDKAALTEALSRAEAHSPYLRLLMGRFPEVADLLAGGKLEAALDTHRRGDPDATIAAQLRHAKGRLALAVAIGDLAGLLTLEQVTAALSDFADFALDAAISDAIVAHVPGAEAQGLAAIALGKHGSSELNYSSDIDPILLFDPDTLPHRSREEPVEAAVRIGRRIVETMQARDGDGYVFRIDLRLRPNPEVTPIVLPVEAAISYYESQAAAWERAAFIRSRACSGNVALGQGFLDAIKPFVWRRGLDFGAIREIRGMSRRIRDHHASGQAFGPGYDLKRGRGGIREVEFFAQIHQMIHGGREPALRAAPTLDALAALGAAGRIDPDHAATLAEAYRRFRTVEHRLQMIDDQQTHSLPKTFEALDTVALLDGLADGNALIATLEPHVMAVGSIYDALDGDETATVPADDDRLAEVLAAAGFSDPAQAARLIEHWRGGTIRALRTPAAREALETVLPGLIAALGAAPEPHHAIVQLSSLVERLPSAINLFRLLDARPALRKLLIDILSHAPTLAEALARRADLLDALIDATALDPPGSVAELHAAMASAGDVEEQLDQVRRVVGEQRFALGVQVIEGAADPIAVAAGYARVAEAALGVVADTTITAFERAHGRVPGSEFVVLALGRMGGAELTHASDLDLIYLFTGDFAAESDGAKPLGAVHYYNRLAQRVTAGMSVPTAIGALYEIDTRLRPSGKDGPLVVSLEGFANYQREEAWTWEHMALTRARTIYGSAEARAATEAIIAEVLEAPRDVAKLTADAVTMRAEMFRHKPPAGPLDVKLCDGGLVDLEFAVHVTQLAHRQGLDPNLGAAISQLVEAELMPAAMVHAHQLLTRILVTGRLFAPDAQEPPAATRVVFAKACGAADWAALLADLAATRQSVSAFWNGLAKGTT